MEAFIGTIIGWGPNFAPRGWAFCNGQLMPISQYTAVFSLVGTMYGGDGRTTFALPDLRGRVPMGAGQSPGMSDWRQGTRTGMETATLSVLNLPAHSHPATLTMSSLSASGALKGTTNDATARQPASGLTVAKGNTIGRDNINIYGDASTNTVDLPVEVSVTGSGSVTVGNNGGSQSFSIVQPVQVIQFAFALQGIFPSRN